MWWKLTDSNRGPSACKADALNQLSYASICLRASFKLVDKSSRLFSNYQFFHSLFLVNLDFSFQEDTEPLLHTFQYPD